MPDGVGDELARQEPDIIQVVRREAVIQIIEREPGPRSRLRLGTKVQFDLLWLWDSFRSRSTVLTHGPELPCILVSVNTLREAPSVAPLSREAYRLASVHSHGSRIKRFPQVQTCQGAMRSPGLGQGAQLSGLWHLR